MKSIFFHSLCYHSCWIRFHDALSFSRCLVKRDLHLNSNSKVLDALQKLDEPIMKVTEQFRITKSEVVRINKTKERLWKLENIHPWRSWNAIMLRKNQIPGTWVIGIKMILQSMEIHNMRGSTMQMSPYEIRSRPTFASFEMHNKSKVRKDLIPFTYVFKCECTSHSWVWLFNNVSFHMLTSTCCFFSLRSYSSLMTTEKMMTNKVCVNISNIVI